MKNVVLIGHGQSCTNDPSKTPRRDMKKFTIETIHNEFKKKYPNLKDRVSHEEPYGAVYVHFLENELIQARTEFQQQYSKEKSNGPVLLG